MTKYVLIILIAQLGVSSYDCQGPHKKTGKEHLTGVQWIHSHEEDSLAVMVYRPRDFPFPASRGRSGFLLNQDGTGLYGSIMSTDGIAWDPARWNQLEDNVIEIHLERKSDRAQSRYRYRILSSEHGILKLILIER